jgi:hypothetical protein
MLQSGILYALYVLRCSMNTQLLIFHLQNSLSAHKFTSARTPTTYNLQLPSLLDQCPHKHVLHHGAAAASFHNSSYRRDCAGPRVPQGWAALWAINAQPVARVHIRHVGRTCMGL